jgi:hypothetical protein
MVQTLGCTNMGYKQNPSSRLTWGGVCVLMEYEDLNHLSFH